MWGFTTQDENVHECTKNPVGSQTTTIGNEFWEVSWGSDQQEIKIQPPKTYRINRQGWGFAEQDFWNRHGYATTQIV